MTRSFPMTTPTETAALLESRHADLVGARRTGALAAEHQADCAEPDADGQTRAIGRPLAPAWGGNDGARLAAYRDDAPPPPADTVPLARRSASPNGTGAFGRALLPEVGGTLPLPAGDPSGVRGAGLLNPRNVAPPPVGLAPAEWTTAELREAHGSNPSDVDVLFNLAVRLHRAGLLAEARETLAELADAHDALGQPAQAARIRLMIGEPGTPGGPTQPEAPTAWAAPTVGLGPQTGGFAGAGTVGFAAAPTIGLAGAPTIAFDGAPTIGLVGAVTVGLAGAPTVGLPTAGLGGRTTAGLDLAGAQTVGLPWSGTSALAGDGGADASTVALGTVPFGGRGTATSGLGLTARLRQTGAFGGGTVALRATTVFAPSPLAEEAEAPFPPAALTFTIPLPGEDGLAAELRAAVEESGHNLREGHLQAAFDACLLALDVDDAIAPHSYLPLSLRLAEILTAQRLVGRARTQAETLLRLIDASGRGDLRWMAQRVLLHTGQGDLPSLRRLVELLIEAGQTEHASFYASRLIRLLDGEGLAEEALAYALRLCQSIPGDTRAALEHAVLCLRTGDPAGAEARWRTALAAGADPFVAGASLAALAAETDPAGHWRRLAEVAPLAREDRAAGEALVDAYVRTAGALPPAPILDAGHALLLTAVGDPAAEEALAAVAGDRQAPAFGRAAAAVALAGVLAPTGSIGERSAAIRTALALLADPAVADDPAWLGLTGGLPRPEELGLELGEVLLAAQDPAGAAEVLAASQVLRPDHEPIADRLAEAYVRTGQVGAALSVLDDLVNRHRAGGRLEAMAATLRRMSRLAPTNIKLKARLVDTFLQRGFVAEALGELLERAELEERAGLLDDAVVSFQRAADLNWTLGQTEETFALYERLLQLDPERVDNRHALVTLYLQRGRLAEAAEHQRAIVDLAMRHGHKHEAVAALHQVIGLTPDDTGAYYQLGELLSSAGEYGQAERVFRRILTITPDDAIAQAKTSAMAALAEQRRR